MITSTSTRVQKPKCPIMLRLSTISISPWSGIVRSKTVNSCHVCSQLSWAGTKLLPFEVTENLLDYIQLHKSAKTVQKPKCPTMSRISTAPDPPLSAVVINKTVTSCHLCSQLSRAKTKASTPYNRRVPSWLHSPQRVYKNWSVLSCQDYQQFTVLHGLW